MALTKEIVGSSFMINGSSFLFSSKVPLNRNSIEKCFLVRPRLDLLERRSLLHSRKDLKGPVAAISEDLFKAAVPLLPVDKPVKFRVRAVITVRNKIKEELRETIVKHLDAFTDKIGRNVALQLVSTQIDPSKLHDFSISSLFIF